MTTFVGINRAPVLTLWAAVVAERLGFERAEALTLGRAVAGLNAHSKGVALGLFKPTPQEVRDRRAALRPKETLTVDLLHRAVPAVHTDQGLRALDKDKPSNPAAVDRYLQSKFGQALDEVRAAMQMLAESLPPDQLAAKAYSLYERFRPSVPAGTRGWGAKGSLDVAAIRELACRSAGSGSA
jgi:hypothetical protein